MGKVPHKWILVALLFVSAPSSAGEPPPYLSFEEYRSLSVELAKKVNLFKDVWQQDPKAEFYGGTSRDFLYWLKGKFSDLKSREQVDGKIAELRALPVIDIRDFISPYSDIDVISERGFSVDANRYGVTKIDSHGPEILDPATDLGRNELNQGHIPAEKIRLASDGPRHSPQFGNGTTEIYHGKLTVKFSTPQAFALTPYARDKMNHPILLALRYLRLLSMDYFYSYGRGFPNMDKLLDIDPASASEVRKVVLGVQNGMELTPYLQQADFRRWINATIQKSFRSYSNPTAARKLYEHFGAETLPGLYSGIEPFNQYLFATPPRNWAEIRANFAAFGTNESEIFQPATGYFPDGKIYHGVRAAQADEAAKIIRNIQTQGVIPSTGGAAGGSGMYGVSVAHRHYAENWGGGKDNLVSFDVSPDAKIIDMTDGPGRILWKKYVASTTGSSETDFASKFGADILIYPFHANAVIVKNSAVLHNPQGVYRQFLTLKQILEKAQAAMSLRDLNDLANFAKTNFLTQNEIEMVLDSVPRQRVHHLVRNFKSEVTLADLWHLLGPSDEMEERIRKYLGIPIERDSVIEVLRSRDPWSIEGLNPSDRRTLLSNQLAAISHMGKSSVGFYEEALRGFLENTHWRNAGLEIMAISELEVSLDNPTGWSNQTDLRRVVIQVLLSGSDAISERKKLLERLLRFPEMQNDRILVEFFSAPFARTPRLLFLAAKTGFLSRLGNVGSVLRVLISDPRYGAQFLDWLETPEGTRMWRRNPEFLRAAPPDRIKMWIDRDPTFWPAETRLDVANALFDLADERSEFSLNGAFEKLDQYFVDWTSEDMNTLRIDAAIKEGKNSKSRARALTFLIDKILRHDQKNMYIDGVVLQLLETAPWNRHPLRDIWLEALEKDPQKRKTGMLPGFGRTRSRGDYMNVRMGQFGKAALSELVGKWAESVGPKPNVVQVADGGVLAKMKSMTGAQRDWFALDLSSKPDGLSSLADEIKSAGDWTGLAELLPHFRFRARQNLLKQVDQEIDHLDPDVVPETTRKQLAAQGLLDRNPDNPRMRFFERTLAGIGESTQGVFANLPAFQPPPVPDAVPYFASLNRVAHFLKSDGAGKDPVLTREVLLALPQYLDHNLWTHDQAKITAWSQLSLALEKVLKGPEGLKTVEQLRKKIGAMVFHQEKLGDWSRTLHELYLAALPGFENAEEADFARIRIMAALPPDQHDKIGLHAHWMRSTPKNEENWVNEIRESIKVRSAVTADDLRSIRNLNSLGRVGPPLWWKALYENSGVTRDTNTLLAALELDKGIGTPWADRVNQAFLERLQREGPNDGLQKLADRLLGPRLNSVNHGDLAWAITHILRIDWPDKALQESWIAEAVTRIQSRYPDATPEGDALKRLIDDQVFQHDPWKSHPGLPAWEARMKIKKLRDGRYSSGVVIRKSDRVCREFFNTLRTRWFYPNH